RGAGAVGAVGGLPGRAAGAHPAQVVDVVVAGDRDELAEQVGVVLGEVRRAVAAHGDAGRGRGVGAGGGGAPDGGDGGRNDEALHPALAVARVGPLGVGVDVALAV